MKKRFLLPLIAIAAPITIGVADAAIHMAGCSLGNQGACEELDRRKAHSEELAAKNAEKAAAKAKEEAARKAVEAKEEAARKREASKWQPTKTNIQQLAFACSQQKLKPFLKDPNSLRILNRGMSKLTDTHVTVWVDYTATNGFGGRVQDVQTCTYTR